MEWVSLQGKITQHTFEMIIYRKKKTNACTVFASAQQVYGDIEPNQWTSQWQDVLRSENNNQENSNMEVD